MRFTWGDVTYQMYILYYTYIRMLFTCIWIYLFMWGRGIKISVYTYYDCIQFIHLFIHISMLMICANNNGVLKAPLFPMTLFIQAFAMRHALQSSTFEKKQFINLVSIKFNKSSTCLLSCTTYQHDQHDTLQTHVLCRKKRWGKCSTRLWTKKHFHWSIFHTHVARIIKSLGTQKIMTDFDHRNFGQLMDFQNWRTLDLL